MTDKVRPDPTPPPALVRSFNPWRIRAIDKEKRTVEADVSTETVDRQGDIVMADGWMLENYRRNPVVLWAHDYAQPPIGRAVEIGVVAGDGGKRLRSVTEFADTPLARDVFSLYADGFMRAFSVGFRPTKWEAMYSEATPESPERFLGYRYTEQDLLEYSAVPVPANPEALARAMQKGLYAEAAASYARLAGPLTPASADDGDDVDRIVSAMRVLRARFNVSTARYIIGG